MILQVNKFYWSLWNTKRGLMISLSDGVENGPNTFWSWTWTLYFWRRILKKCASMGGDQTHLSGRKMRNVNFLRADLNVDLKSIDTQSVATQDFFFCTKLALLNFFNFFLKNWNIHSVKNNCSSSVPCGQPRWGVRRLDWHRVRHCLRLVAVLWGGANRDIMAHGYYGHTATQVRPQPGDKGTYCWAERYSPD